MNQLKKLFLRDNFFFGALIGFILPAIAFLIINYISSLAGNDKFMIKPFGEDNMQVYAILANLIPFRIYMVNHKMDNTGRGILFATFVLVILYYIMYFQHKP